MICWICKGSGRLRGDVCTYCYGAGQALNPHNSITALDPQGMGAARRWKCRFCSTVATYEEMLKIECAHVYPACIYCGETPHCTEDCIGVARALAGEPMPE